PSNSLPSLTYKRCPPHFPRPRHAHLAMTTKGKTTTDHDEIRRWAEARGGRPMAVRDEGEEGREPIRLAFPGASAEDAEGLAPVSWGGWFERFDRHGLALLIEETTSMGQQSRFNKLVSR